MRWKPRRMARLLFHVTAILTKCNATRYTTPVIKSFRDGDTARVFAGRRVEKVPPDVLDLVEAKLAVLDQAESLRELALPPSNRLWCAAGAPSPRIRRSGLPAGPYSGGNHQYVVFGTARERFVLIEIKSVILDPTPLKRRISMSKKMVSVVAVLGATVVR